jgi:ATP-binding cassette, subfamily B, multidrug efflux pump
MFRFFETRIDPFRDHDDSTPPATLFGYYGRYCRQVWPYLVALMAISLIVSLIEVTILRFIGALVDLLRSTSPDKVLHDHGGEFLAMALLILIGRPMASFAHDLVVQQAIAPGMTNLIRWQTHRYVLRQSVSYFANDFAGRIASNIVTAAASLRDSVVQIIDALWFVAVFAFSALFIFAQTDWRLAAPLGLWIAVYISALSFFVPRIRRRSEALAHMRATVTGRVVDSYTNIQTVKLFAHLEREDEHAREALADHTAAFHRQTRLITFLNLTVSMSNSLLLVSVGTIAVWLWAHGAVSLGDIAVATGLALRVALMSGWVMWTSIGIFDNVGQVQEGMRTIARPRALTDRADARTLAVPKGGIRFENVRFHYGKAGGVIDDLSFTIAPGEKVGLVGRSGAGKSTLVNLLLRFYDVEAGRILIDGQDIAATTQDSLRRQIGMVTQDTSLLHRSIGENILYGRPDATFEAMLAAAQQAHAHDFVIGLTDPDGRKGYDTLVGERGVKLSGGQRQRIAIARVLLKNAPILVLDEATSALDSEVEAAIQENFQTLMHGKTVIAIAHRLSTIAAMDRLIVLEDGDIVETGTHQELLSRGGIYAALWRRQSGGFLDARAA